ncbi:MAG TPA: cell division protein FtsA [Candidatus Paceibacterota bacterium]|jgi:cell division protein FtsA
MARNITTGIDVGTNQVRVVIAEHKRDKKRRFPVIVGTGMAQSRGLRHGYIINTGDIARSIKAAVQQAEKAAGIQVKRAYISIGGVGLDEVRAKSDILISRADSEVTDFDIEKALQENEKRVADRVINRKILHVIPLAYKVDGSPVLGRPHGMRGTKIEVEALFITCLEQHLNDLIQAVEEVGVEVEDVMASPLAGSLVVLSKSQKIAGCVLANIGAETVSIVVFENNTPISVKVFPIGSTDITNDIALGLKISLEEAEQLKRGAIVGSTFPKKRLDEIIAARFSDIFELIEAHLESIGKSGLLPAGIILTGGGTGIATVEDMARGALKLPSKIASLHAMNGSNKNVVRDSSWAVAYGLCLWGLTASEDSPGFQLARRTGGNIFRWIKQFLP